MKLSELSDEAFEVYLTGRFPEEWTTEERTLVEQSRSLDALLKLLELLRLKRDKVPASARLKIRVNLELLKH